MRQTFDTHADIIRAIHVRDARVKSDAIVALRDMGEEKALALLEQAMTDATPENRDDVVFALRRLRWDSALDRVEKALADPAATVRRAAAWSLGQVGRLGALARAMEDPDADVREAATYWVRQMWEVVA